MHTAHCTLDDTTYSALQFSHLNEQDLGEKRRHLICPGQNCAARSFYRRRSRDGRAAHFGSTSHRVGCDAAAPGPPAAGNGLDEELTEMLNLGEELIIDTRTSSVPTGQHHDPTEDYSRPTPTPRHTRGDDDGPRRARSSKRLRPILRELRRSPAFARAGRKVRLHTWPDLAISDRDFFHEIANLTTDHAERDDTRGGYWGTIISTGDTETGLWLNFGPPGTASVVVSAPSVQHFLDGTGAATLEDLVGSSLIVLTHLELSHRGKLYLRLPSETDWAWLPFPDPPP